MEGKGKVCVPIYFNPALNNIQRKSTAAPNTPSIALTTPCTELYTRVSFPCHRVHICVVGIDPQLAACLCGRSRRNCFRRHARALRGGGGIRGPHHPRRVAIAYPPSASPPLILSLPLRPALVIDICPSAWHSWKSNVRVPLV